MKHRPELDGLRGIAILIVLAAHAHVPGFGGGGAGVTLFFGLSGYLITSLLLAEHSRAGRVDLRAFYIRRALRLFPVLWAVLLGVLVLVLVGLMPQVGGWIGIAGLCALAWIWPAPAGAGVVLLPVAAVLGTISVAGCPRLLAWGPLAFIGKISYGLYLYHGVIIWWGLAWPVTIVISIGISWLSYVLLERRFLKLKSRLRAAQPLAPALSPQPRPT
jgi:peptidoglycan/LPS O-acetylase OafA/YrhL